jgi:hypothetical protein
MKRLSMACAVLAMVGATQATGFAAPVQIDFNTAGFAGPTIGTTNTFVKDNVVGELDLTFQSLDAQLNLAHSLYWDANDGNGFADGFGVLGTGQTSYSKDEIEGDERFGIRFSQSVHLLGFNLTDFFIESEPSNGSCTPGAPNCYFERGFFMVEFGNGTASQWIQFDAFDWATRTTNGLFDISMDFENVVGLLFRAPGATPNAFAGGYKKLEDFSVAGIRIDQTVPAPEPGTMMLVGLGITGIIARRRRARA